MCEPGLGALANLATSKVRTLTLTLNPNPLTLTLTLTLTPATRKARTEAVVRAGALGPIIAALRAHGAHNADGAHDTGADADADDAHADDGAGADGAHNGFDGRAALVCQHACRALQYLAVRSGALRQAIVAP